MQKRRTHCQITHANHCQVQPDPQASHVANYWQITSYYIESL